MATAQRGVRPHAVCGDATGELTQTADNMTSKFDIDLSEAA